MATGKRQPSKQKRAAQNRAQRAALAARRDAATASSRTPAGAGSTSRAGGGLLGRLRGGGGGTGLRASAAAGRAGQPVGYRAGLAALLMSVAGLVFCFTFSVPVDADDEPFTRERLTAAWAGTALEEASANPDATPAELVEGIDEWTPGRGETPIALALWPFSLTLALPVIGAGLGFRAVAKRSSSRIVSRALFATLFGSLLSQIPIFFLPSVIALGVAVFQIRKYETTVARAEAAGVVDDDGVIDVDALDEDERAADDELATDDKPPVEVADADDVEPVRPDER